VDNGLGELQILINESNWYLCGILETWWEHWCDGTGMGYYSLGKDQVDNDTWLEMVLWKWDLGCLEIGVAVGVMMGLGKK